MGRSRLISQLFISLLVLLPEGTAYASDDARLTLNGYYKNLLSTSRTLDGKEYYADLNRLRLDAEYSPGEAVTLKLVLDNEAVFGSVLDTAEFKLLKDVRQTYYDLDETIADTPDLWWRMTVYRVYGTVKRGKTVLTAGRQRLAWGSGRLWNPTDIFNPVSPLSLERDEKTGTDAVSFDYNIGPLSAITGVFAPEREGSDNVALRAKTNVKGYDASLVLASLRDREIVGFDFAGSIGASGFRGEATHEERRRPDVFFPDKKRYSRAVLSWDYTFPGTLYVLLEYLYNGGNTGAGHIQQAFQREIITRDRNFFAVGIGYDLTPLLRADGIIITDVDRTGFFLNPSVKYNFVENMDWAVGIQIFAGQGDFEDLSNLYYTWLKIFF